MLKLLAMRQAVNLKCCCLRQAWMGTRKDEAGLTGVHLAAKGKMSRPSALGRLTTAENPWQVTVVVADSDPDVWERRGQSCSDLAVCAARVLRGAAGYSRFDARVACPSRSDVGREA